MVEDTRSSTLGVVVVVCLSLDSEYATVSAETGLLLGDIVVVSVTTGALEVVTDEVSTLLLASLISVGAIDDTMTSTGCSGALVATTAGLKVVVGTSGDSWLDVTTSAG